MWEDVTIMVQICWPEVAAEEKCNKEHKSIGHNRRNEESAANVLVRSACRIYEM